jgi:hypothetical protein
MTKTKKQTKTFKKVIIAGSRDVFDFQMLNKALEYAKTNGIDIDKAEEIVCGCAPGVDTMGRCWAEKHDKKVVKFPADWNNVENSKRIKINQYGHKYAADAYIQRNIKMAIYADALILIISNDSYQLRHLMKCVKQYNKPIVIYEI